MQNDENKVDNPLPPVFDPLLERVKNTFFDEYSPTTTFEAGVLFMSTQDIYNLFFNLYPNPIAYSSAQIATWMHEKGFTFIKMKELQYEWMLLPAS